MKMLSLTVGAALALVSWSASANAYSFGFDRDSFAQAPESQVSESMSNGIVGFETLRIPYEDRFDPWTDLWPGLRTPKDEHRSIPWIDPWLDLHPPKDNTCRHVLADRIDCARVLHT